MMNNKGIPKIIQKTQQQNKKDSLLVHLTNATKKITEMIVQGKLSVGNSFAKKNKPNQVPLLQKKADKIKEELSQLNNQLINIRESLSNQKELQKKAFQQKQIEAISLVDRLKAQKFQLKKKLKFMSVQQSIKNKAFSQSIAKMVRSETQRKVNKKKQQLKEKIQKIINRQRQRTSQVQKRETMYWERMKSIDNRISSSGCLFPKILKGNVQQLEPIYEKKNNLSDWNEINNHNTKYDQKIKQFILYKQNKEILEKEKQKLSPLERQKSKHERIQQGNNFLSESIRNFTEEDRLKSSKIKLQSGLILQNKYKSIGNQYLKQSLLKIDKHHQKKNIKKISNPQQITKQRLNYLPLIRQKNRQELLNKWNSVKQLIKKGKIQKMTGLKVLNNIEENLDIVDKDGMPERLKIKLNIITDEQ